MTPSEQIEIAKLLLPQKLEFIRMSYETGMTWWVSSVVFCASVLAAVWVKREELQALNRLHLAWLWLVIFFFFSSIVVYGFFIIKQLNAIAVEVNQLLLSINSNTSMSEVDTLTNGYMIGTSSFILVLITWIGFAFILFDQKKKINALQ